MNPTVDNLALTGGPAPAIEPAPAPPAAPAIGAAPLAIVTGASSGIGREMATLLARRGYRTVLMARRTELIENLAGKLQPLAPSRAVTVDLCDEASTAAALARTESEMGPADLLINNAGAGMLRRFLDHGPADHQRMMWLHYFAAVTLIHAVLPGMLLRGKGHVINIASIASKMGPWGHATYAAAKSAIVSLTQSLAAEYGGQGVHFSYVNPGLVKTSFFDAPGYDALQSQVTRHGIEPAAAAKKILTLLDKPRLELCIPGHYRVLDWLKAISPTWAHRLVARNSKPRKR